MTDNTSKNGQGAITGGWVCLALGAVILLLPSLFSLPMSLLVGSFVLAIAALALAIITLIKRRGGQGVLLLLASLVLAISVWASTTLDFVSEASSEMEEQQAAGLLEERTDAKQA